ncbi:Hypothetical protein D9617_52g060430 [Elsinoe fawcettii]|nr:Hypothetical protein D9617_52g060430 [Elsinoe fawcettii]
MRTRGCLRVKEMGENRSSALVSGWKRKRYAAWLGVYLEQACETWSAGSLETGPGNAKGVKTWGVLKLDGGSEWSKIPPLQRADGSATTNKSEQAEQLLDTFSPALPETIEDEGDRPQRQPISMPALTVEKIEPCLTKTKPWKAAGEDGLPAGMWRQVWPVVSESVRSLFQTSLDTGVIPQQWKVAKIIPLKKPNKGGYTLAKA